MTFFATCTFDLKDGSAQDYQNAYSDLARLGFSTRVVSDRGRTITLPTTTTVGEFEGSDAGSLRDALSDRVRSAFAARGFVSEVFLTVAGGWAWGHRTT